MGQARRLILSSSYNIDGTSDLLVAPPIETIVGTFVLGDPSSNGNLTTIYLFVPQGSPRDAEYRGMLVENTTVGTPDQGGNTTRKVGTCTAYNGSLRLATVRVADATVWNLTDSFCLRRQLALAFGLPSVGSTRAQLILPWALQLPSAQLLSSYIRVRQRIYSSQQANAGEYKIVAWDSVSATASINPPLDSIPFDVVPLDVEIMPTSYDNATLLVNARLAAAATRYRLSLIHLMMPLNEMGSYSSLFVRLASGNLGRQGAMGNNSAAANTANFVAHLDPNSNSPLWTKLTGDGMLVDIQFDPKDTLTLTLLLPSGQVWQPQEKDEVGLRPPNPFLQCSALFSYEPSGERAAAAEARPVMFSIDYTSG
jgi:hypothetical protein